MRACDAMKGISLDRVPLACHLMSNRNLVEDDYDWIPEIEMPEERPVPVERDELDPIYKLVTVEEGYSPVRVFKYINTLIGKPKVTPETFIKFGRNKYLFKVREPQGLMLQGLGGGFHESGIISVQPYDDYNGSKGKILNENLAKCSKEELLELCPRNVLDCFNITKFDRESNGRVNTPAIILKFSNNTPPDQVAIGPFRTRVKSYTPSPRFCTKCLKYGHTKTRCSALSHLYVNCGQEHRLIQ